MSAMISSLEGTEKYIAFFEASLKIKFISVNFHICFRENFGGARSSETLVIR